MDRLSEHPLVVADHLSLEGDERQMSHHLRHLLHLDPRAAYAELAGSTIVYYQSPAQEYEAGTCGRIVLDERGWHRPGRVGRVGFDPRSTAGRRELLHGVH